MLASDLVLARDLGEGIEVGGWAYSNVWATCAVCAWYSPAGEVAQKIVKFAVIVPPKIRSSLVVQDETERCGGVVWCGVVWLGEV